MNKEKKEIWQFPWRYKESMAIIGGILLVGAMLQLTVGPFNYYLLHNPVNLIAGIAIVLILIAASFARESTFFRWFTSVPFAVSTIGAMLILALIMGLTPQLANIHSHNMDIFTKLGFTQMTQSWPFVLIYTLTLFSLGGLIVRRLISFKISDYAFYLNHIGLWILLCAAGLGAADIVRIPVQTYIGETKWEVDGMYLPLGIELNSFIMEVYPPKLAIIDRETGMIQPEEKPAFFQIDEKHRDGHLAGWDIHLDDYIHNAIRDSDSSYYEIVMPASHPAAKITATNTKTGEVKKGWVSGGGPSQLYMLLDLNPKYIMVTTEPEPKRFASDINVYDHEQNLIEKNYILEVNKPLRIGHSTLYQYSYDDRRGAMSNYSIIELVYDPWLYPVYVGIIMLGIGSICLLWSGNKKKKEEESK